MHLDRYLPERIELAAVRIEDWGTESVMTDGGIEVRNQRWALPQRRYEVAMPPMRRNDADYVALRQLYTDAKGKLHSFNLTDFTDESTSTVVAVRFDTELQITSIATHLDHIDTFTLVEDKSA